MIVLVTGGAGYIGSVLVEKLAAKGYKVRVFDRFYFGEESLRHLKDKIEMVRGDVRQFPASALDGVSSVIHLGSLSNDPTADFDPKANHEINFEGTMRVAEACKKAGVKRFSYASSCAVIGFHVGEVADESFKPNPQSEYARSKLDGEIGILSLTSSDFCPVAFRQATVFGFSRRMRYDLVVNTMVKDAFKNGTIFVYHAGEMWRPLVDVKDVADAHIHAIEADEAFVKGQVFNLVRENVKIADLAFMIKDFLKDKKDVAVEVQKGSVETRSYRVSGEKYKKAFGEPRISIADSARQIYDLLADGKYVDFDNPIYYNIDWMKHLVEKYGKKEVFLL
ncbi:MAG: SDR family oxidoreductase [Candidatus Margulisiibacteriota bacterium]